MVIPAEDYYPDHNGGECAPIEAATVKNIAQWIELTRFRTPAPETGSVSLSERNEMGCTKAKMSQTRSTYRAVQAVLSSRTRCLVGAAELERMKPPAPLLNASRVPIVEEQDLISVLKNKQLANAAIDVFDIEPLPPHPFRTLANVLATPHIGYVSHVLCKTFYDDTVSNIRHP